jgi:hypothetical protein
LTIPGLVIGMSNFAKDGGEFTPPSYIKVKKVSTHDAGSFPFLPLYFYMEPSRDDDDPYGLILPPGIALGLVHSRIITKGDIKEKVFGYTADTGPDYLGVNLIKKENGGDMGENTGIGWYWYESTGQGFSDWNLIKCLPRGTVIGLKHSINQRGKLLIWQAKVYDAANQAISPPQGFLRRFYQDQCADGGQGYFWYEKITDPPQD